VAIQANKPNSRVFLLLGVVLAAAAAVAVLLLLRSNTPASDVSVVVTDASIPAGTTLTPAMVIVAEVPATTKPGDAYTDATAVVGKTTTVALEANETLVPEFFSTPALSITSTGTGTTVTDVETQITKGYVAVAIPTSATVPSSFTAAQQANVSSDLVAAGYYIQPGDHIDILIDTGVGDGGVRFSFQDVIVLRVGASATTASASPALLLVEVPRSQAALLTSLTVGSGGHEFVLRYVLRPESEWGKLAADGSSYAPNYEASGNPTIPNVAETTVTPAMLDNLFGH
jgi:Flp pilus assembly protein CpaB